MEMLPKTRTGWLYRKNGVGGGKSTNSGIDAILKIAIDVICKIAYILIDYVSNVNVTAANFLVLY